MTVISGESIIAIASVLGIANHIAESVVLARTRRTRIHNCLASSSGETVSTSARVDLSQVHSSALSVVQARLRDARIGIDFTAIAREPIATVTSIGQSSCGPASASVLALRVSARVGSNFATSSRKTLVARTSESCQSSRLAKAVVKARTRGTRIWRILASLAREAVEACASVSGQTSIGTLAIV